MRLRAHCLTVIALCGCAMSTLSPRQNGGGGSDAAMEPVMDPPWIDAGARSAPDASDPSPQQGPLPLRCGRTYDQELEYFAHTGRVHFVMLTHRDGTALPPSEGGASCGRDCTEQVTRIEAGGSIRGVFEGASGFTVQGASEPGAGTIALEACDQHMGSVVLTSPPTTPGFMNLPEGGWTPPTQGRCAFRVSAVGSFVDVRAVTLLCPAPTEPPTVDLKINGSDGPLTLASPADLALSWSSPTADRCTASGDWAGARANGGVEAHHGVADGAYTYVLTCSNAIGSASDSVRVSVVSAPY